MVAKAFDEGWAGVAFKTIGMFTPNEVSRDLLNLIRKIQLLSVLKILNISTYSLEENLDFFRKLKENYPTKVIIASIMGSNDKTCLSLRKGRRRRTCGYQHHKKHYEC